LIVIAGTWSGIPAISAAVRATFIPCSASGIAQPMITSSTRAGSSPGTFDSAPRIEIAARSSGRVSLRLPLYAFPTAVRTEAMIYALLIVVFLPAA